MEMVTYFTMNVIFTILLYIHVFVYINKYIYICMTFSTKGILLNGLS